MADRDADVFTNDLTIAISRLNQANEGLIKSFGEAGEGGNKLWNVISRFSSGSTFWRLQNYLRGVSNIVQAYTNANEENQKSILKNMEANLGLADSLKTLQEQRKKITEQPLYKLFVQDLGDEKLAKETAENFFDTQINAIKKVALKRGKQFRKKFFGRSLRQRFDDANPFAATKDVTRRGFTAKDVPAPVTGAFRFIVKEASEPLNKTMGMFQKIGGGLNNILRGKLGTGDPHPNDPMMQRETRQGFLKTQINNAKKLKKILPMAGKYLTMTLAALGKFLIYGLLVVLGITLLAKIIKKGWPYLSKQFGSAFKFFKAAFMNIIGIIRGVFKLFNAIFRGDVLGALEIFFKDIFLNVVKLIANVLAGLFKVLVGVIGGLLSGLYENTIGRFFSTGGVSMGGPAIVGERGPELVTLPRGAKISNNANSMGTRAGGNNIHVHINGRVGASDAEIRDIANKVAREINIRMNRTGANRIGA
tara:strand:+ start:15349 stop:16779 length:1431 start_codon:yes stop_codon:yes gene_type:complete